jgi:hypothetical protein
VIAPNIVVEAPAPVVVVERVEHYPVPVLAGYPTFGFGIPFAPIPGQPISSRVPERITPLFNPAGRLHGSAVTPLGSSSFTRPSPF